MATQLMTLNNQFHNNILDVGDRVMWNCCFLFMSVIYVNHRISLIYHIDEIFLKGLFHICKLYTQHRLSMNSQIHSMSYRIMLLNFKNINIFSSEMISVKENQNSRLNVILISPLHLTQKINTGHTDNFCPRAQKIFFVPHISMGY